MSGALHLHTLQAFHIDRDGPRGLRDCDCVGSWTGLGWGDRACAFLHDYPRGGAGGEVYDLANME